MSLATHGTCAVVLAAGGSTRLGRPKQLVSFAGERLLERAVRIVLEAGFTPVVVLGAASEQVVDGCNLSRCHVLIHPDWQSGMGGSIRVGVAAAQALGAEKVLLMTCDQPAVTVEHLLRLACAPELPASSAYAERKGVPACFSAASFAALMALSGDMGARELLRDTPAIELPGGELDVDTEETVQLAEQLLGQTE